MRWLLISLVVLGSAFLGLSVMGPGVAGISPDGFVTITRDRALRHDIRSSTSSSDIEREIHQALSRGDDDEALMYRNIATFARLPLGVETIRSLSAIEPASLSAFSEQNILPSADEIYRILAMEGSKLIAGESFDQFALGLAIANISSQSLEGSVTPPKTGIDLLHTAHASNKLNADFAAYIKQLIQDAVNFTDVQNALTTTRIADRTATYTSLQTQMPNLGSAELIIVSEALDTLSDRVGPEHTVNLMSYIRSPQDLTALVEMSDTLKGRTYGIVKLTGRTSLDDLPTEIPFESFLSRNTLALVIWAGGLVIALVGRQVFRSRWRRLTLDDDPKPEPVDPTLPAYVKDSKIKKARV